MRAQIRGSSTGVPNPLPPLVKPLDTTLDQDMTALRTPLWTAPGGGYSYASNSPHIASIVLRKITGKEVRDYLDEKMGQPIGFGEWGWQKQAGSKALPHNPGGGGVAVHSTDALRFAYSCSTTEFGPASKLFRRATSGDVSALAVPEACAVQPDDGSQRARSRRRRAS